MFQMLLRLMFFFSNFKTVIRFWIKMRLTYCLCKLPRFLWWDVCQRTFTLGNIRYGMCHQLATLHSLKVLNNFHTRFTCLMFQLGDNTHTHNKNIQYSLRHRKIVFFGGTLRICFWIPMILDELPFLSFLTISPRKPI